MLLPIGAAFGTSIVAAIPTRPVESRTVLATVESRTPTGRAAAIGAIIARTRKARAIAAIVIARPVVTRLVEFWTVEISRTFTGGARVASPTPRRSVIALLPGFEIAAVPAKLPVAWRAVAEILARAARELLVAVEFSFRAAGKRPISTGTVTVWRPRIERTIATRTITVLAEALAAWRVGPLLAILAMRVRLLVAEFSVLETPSRTRVAITVRPVAARRVWTFVAAIFSRPE